MHMMKVVYIQSAKISHCNWWNCRQPPPSPTTISKFSDDGPGWAACLQLIIEILGVNNGVRGSFPNNEDIVQVATDDEGMVFALDGNGTLYLREGVKDNNHIGTHWFPLYKHKFKYISVHDLEIFGMDENGTIWRGSKYTALKCPCNEIWPKHFMIACWRSFEMMKRRFCRTMLPCCVAFVWEIFRFVWYANVLVVTSHHIRSFYRFHAFNTV